MVEWVEQRGADVRIRVRVQPRASRTEVAGEHDGALRIRVAAPPVEGEANHALVRFLSKRLRVAASRITVVSGVTSRTKRVEVEGVDAADVARRLAV
ncbi:MAG: DUF167 family protein [Gemmatimonadota bacterium]|jgi:uncharacterized protein (TIGR00251 family)